MFLPGCLPQCPDIEPEIIVIEPEYKEYPVELLQPLESVTVYPLTTPGIIAGIKEEDIKAIKRNNEKFIKWGTTNQGTLEKINSLSIEKAKEKGEEQ